MNEQNGQVDIEAVKAELRSAMSGHWEPHWTLTVSYAHARALLDHLERLEANQSQICGHAARLIVSNRDGSNYCGECERVAQLRHAGQQLSNLAYNLSQLGAASFSAREQRIARRLADQWDEARAAFFAATPPAASSEEGGEQHG